MLARSNWHSGNYHQDQVGSGVTKLNLFYTCRFVSWWIVCGTWRGVNTETILHTTFSNVHFFNVFCFVLFYFALLVLLFFFLIAIIQIMPASWHGHDDVIKGKHFPRYWPFVRGIHRSAVNSPHKGQWRGSLMFSVICVWINGSVNNREAGDLRRYRAHYDVIVMTWKRFPHHLPLMVKLNQLCHYSDVTWALNLKSPECSLKSYFGDQHQRNHQRFAFMALFEVNPSITGGFLRHHYPYRVFKVSLVMEWFGKWIILGCL